MADEMKRDESTGEGGGRGFASLTHEERREVASKGGRSQGKETNPGNFANNPERAATAGRKGGQASHGSTEE